MGYYNTENSDSTDPIRLEFRHNANNDDNDGIILNHIATFKLDKLQKADRQAIEFEIATTNLFENEQILKGIYNY